MSPIPFVVLHGFDGLTFGEYLLRVLLSLLVFSGISVFVLLGVRLSGKIQTAIAGHR
jgi:hypothetical protein